MKLYEINYKIRELWNKIEEQEGELTEQDLLELESLEIAKDEKVKAYGVIIREISAEIAECKAETDRIKEISDKKKKTLKGLKQPLKTLCLTTICQSMKV